ncbi:glycosyltransferase family 2 protein [Modestobacter muralis]|uniref:Glycosyltransferase family 2 protein n=1 Tax=Modestobacter muralis TaxID=1608614 RepID=A0A6P0HCY4_9ACTN|nr:glycosyltransferase family 2 protein [Modestobacter muralis]NEK96445.1 glycosyltransferase family 2 protein [Modestobacter muralis]NEN53345.1 glycosyltransferase family 2 protein [Modestobacter muralis]
MTQVLHPHAHAAPRSTSARRADTLTVVVCAYTTERTADVAAALASLAGQTRRPDQVLLVVDHSPELLAWARATVGEDVTVLPSTGPRGLSGARNTGVAAATGDVVAFLDDDAAAEPDWAQQLMAAFAEDDVIGVGGGVEPAWPALRPSWFPPEFLWVVGCSYTGLPTTRAQIRNPIGANMAFRRDVFTAVGGFDTGMGRLGKDAAGCEETEFSIRAGAVPGEGRIVLEPAARVRHTVSTDRVARTYFRRRCLAEGRSKALVSGLAGAGAALSTERDYVRRTLPRGVLRGLGQTLRGDSSGAARAAMIVEGLGWTAAGYLSVRLRAALRPGRRASA